MIQNSIAQKGSRIGEPQQKAHTAGSPAEVDRLCADQMTRIRQTGLLQIARNAWLSLEDEASVTCAAISGESNDFCTHIDFLPLLKRWLLLTDDKDRLSLTAELDGNECWGTALTT